MGGGGVVDQGQCEEKRSWEGIMGKAGFRDKEVKKDPQWTLRSRVREMEENQKIDFMDHGQ